MISLVEIAGSRRVTEDAFSVRLALPEDLIWFSGHFPAQPLLPGVAQLEWVMQFANAWLGSIRLEEIQTVKFVQPVLPRETLELRLRKKEINEAEISLHFEYLLLQEGIEETTISLGRLKVMR